MLDKLETLARAGLTSGKLIVSSGNVGRGFHHTRKGPGRIHNNSTTELRLKHLPAGIQFNERERLNRWPTKVAKFYNRFGFCPVSPVLDL